MKNKCKIVDTTVKNIVIIFLILLFGGAILIVSISRAGLEIMARENNEGKLRVQPIMIDNKLIYSLPEVGIMPGNLLYGFKKIRDSLWERLSSGSTRKAKILLLMADKKMAETRALIDKGDERRALKSGSEAVYKLKYARMLVAETEGLVIEKEQLTNQIKEATIAYKEIIKGIDNPKLQQEIDDLKEEQEKKSEAKN